MQGNFHHKLIIFLRPYVFSKYWANFVFQNDVKQHKFLFLVRKSIRGVIVKATDCRIVVSEFKLQSCYYVHLWTNTLGKGMNPLILPAMG